VNRPDAEELFRTYRASGDRRVRNELVEGHRWVAVHCARRFSDRGEMYDDLLQVAMLGVVKAVERYDPARGTAFSTFAIPTVMGELRRHFRDATWPLKVPRRVKDLSIGLSSIIQQLAHELGRSPQVDEVAARAGASVDDVLEALEAGAAYRPAPLPSPGTTPGDGYLDERFGVEDTELRVSEVRVLLRELVVDLPARERRILYLRFYEGRTQAEIADDLGISQVHVSRLLRASLDQLHGHLRDRDDLPEGTAAGGVGC
jgi:RNA polymerase sigma-B factor